MTKGEPIDRLRAMVAEYQKRLNIEHWQILVVMVPPRTDVIADIQFAEYDRQATIRWNDDHPEEEWEWTVAHELTHVVVKPMADLLDTMLERVHPGEKPAFEPLVKEVEEKVIHSLESVLVGKPKPFHKNMTHSWKFVE